MTEKANPQQPANTEEDQETNGKKALLVHLPIGVKMDIEIARTAKIGELKEIVCLAHGYDPEQNGLMLRGIVLPDESILANHPIKKKDILEVVLTMRLQRMNSWEERFSGDEASPRKNSYEESDSEGEEIVSSHGNSSGRSSRSEDLDDARKATLSKRLTSGGMHANELSPMKARRQMARKAAQEKAASRHHDRFRRKNHVNDQKDRSDFMSSLSEVAYKFLPNLLVQCVDLAHDHTPEHLTVQPSILRPPTKFHSMGGA